MAEKKETTKKATQPKASKAKTAAKKVKNPAVLGYIKRPYITEKATKMQDDGKYAFRVTKDANKVAIGQAIEQYYGVDVVSVNIINRKGKTKRRRGTMGTTKAIKKAIVTLKKGQEITTLTT